MKSSINPKQLTPSRFRLWFQGGFFLWVVFIGVQFGRFVHHFTSQGQTPFVNRPPGVDGFLPIGALASFKYWLATGEINPYHPAALVLFVSFLAMSLLAKKSFCSWLCPVGTLSEWLWKGGRRLVGRNLFPWPWLDTLLRCVKYGLLLFFVKILLLDMPTIALKGFLMSPYWALSDVKMLQFFTDPSPTTVAVVALLALLSFFIQNFWCRYLCPYGALLGLISVASPLKIRRDHQSCHHCQRCRQRCPSKLPVSTANVIRSPECTGCLSCTDACPSGAVRMAPPPLFKRLQHWPEWGFPVLALGLYAGGVALGMISGHWHGSLSYADYQQLIPQLHRLGF